MPGRLDIVFLALFPIVIYIESRRGFGRAIFDFAAVLVALETAPPLAEFSASELHIASNSSVNLTIFYIFFFLVESAAFILVAALTYNSTLLDAEFLNPFLGGVVGVGIWMVSAHVLLRSIDLAMGGNSAQLISQTLFAEEFLYFDTYHSIVDKFFMWLLAPQ